MSSRSVPRQDGLSMPAEWSRHKATLVSWPCRGETWRGNIDGASREYAGVIRAILRREPVLVLATPPTIREAKAMLPHSVDFAEIELDDSWIRDNGPIFVTSPAGDVAVVGFLFNGWGNKGPHGLDGKAPEAIADRFGMKRYSCPMVLEGGSISVDGEGTLLTTEQCLLNRNRNPGLSREDVESNLRDYLGVRRVIWLGKGQANDVTDGHVDGVATFFAPAKVMIASTKDESDPNYLALKDNLERLESETDARGRSLEVLKIVQPRPMENRGLSITPCYVNHYIANGGVVAPTYGIREDAVALETLRSAYPEREVVTCSARDLEIGGGGIHCITQQVPEGPPLAAPSLRITAP